jgi:hypothetical protein
MASNIYDFYPIDYLQQLSTDQIRRIREFLYIDRLTQGIQLLMEEAGFTLEQAFQSVQAVETDLNRRFPHPVKPETTILISLGHGERATERIQAYTGHDPAECAGYVQVVENMFPLRLTSPQAQELLDLLKNRRRSEAVDLIWKYCSSLGAARAFDFCSDLERHYETAISPELPAPFRYRIPAPGERYSASIVKPETHPEIDALIQTTFPPASWEGVRLALSLYHSMEPDRVVKAILRQSGGEEKTLLIKVGYAQIDYRNILFGEELRTSGNHDES